ncbi:hypothetical protein [Arthrobacter sp. M4]|uniref:hypothetical protein n=1 Tax=Arthrobacter sp. M4 TaxID=218160 RepID=UPI001CDC2990|nr:hypothetical protein [Arthrobacter sp. M4]MCA4134856.1 hypothetical protein [Arthrobacter sp. M4]
MPEPQQQAWEALFEIHSAQPAGWVLVGGQAVYLHCIERSGTANRATDDADAALDIRSYPGMLYEFTGTLGTLGFEPAGESMEGHQHRWVRGKAKIDVLIPRFLGVHGGTTDRRPRIPAGHRQSRDRRRRRRHSLGEWSTGLPFWAA